MSTEEHERAQRRMQVRLRLETDAPFRRVVDQAVAEVETMLQAKVYGVQREFLGWAAAFALEAAERLSQPTTPTNRSEPLQQPHSADSEPWSDEAYWRSKTNPAAEVDALDGINLVDLDRAPHLKEKIYEAFGVTQAEVDALGPGSYQITTEQQRLWLEMVRADPILGPLLKGRLDGRHRVKGSRCPHTIVVRAVSEGIVGLVCLGKGCRWRSDPLPDPTISRLTILAQDHRDAISRKTNRKDA